MSAFRPRERLVNPQGRPYLAGKAMRQEMPGINREFRAWLLMQWETGGYVGR